MADWTELNQLAEAATPGPWVPDGEYVNEHGHMLSAYVAHANGGRIGEAFSNCLVGTDEQCRANAAFMAAANPQAILELISEVEKLREWYGNSLRMFSECAAAIPTHYMDPPDGGDVDVPEQLRRMAKDVERYRWLRSQHWNEAEMAVVACPKSSVKLGVDCPSLERLDAAIDAAMGKGGHGNG